MRELEQCVRNVTIRGAYRPARAASPGVHKELAGALVAGAFTVEELMRRYCTLVFAQTGNYQETARRLGIARTMASIPVDEDTGTLTQADRETTL